LRRGLEGNFKFRNWIDVKAQILHIRQLGAHTWKSLKFQSCERKAIDYQGHTQQVITHGKVKILLNVHD